MKKITLLFTEISCRGGVELFSSYFFYSIVEVLQRKKVNRIEVILLNNKDLPSIEGDDNKTRIIFRCLASKFRVVRLLKFTFYIVYNLLFVQPDFIISNHINLLKPCFLFFPILKLFAIKYGFVAYGIDVWNLNRLEKLIVRNADIILPISNYTKTKILQQSLIKGEIILFPPTFDENFFSPAPKDPFLIDKYNLKGQKILLTVCRMEKSERYKGYDRVISVLPFVLKEVPNTKYLIVGEGSDKGRVSDLIKKLNLNDNVILCGFVESERLPSYYNLCDVFIMPSTGEGFGIVFLEALACGKPVICGNRDGSIDAVLGGEIGFPIDPTCEAALKDTIVKILKNEITDKRLDSEYLRRKVIEHYGQKKFKERTEFFVDKMIEVKKKSLA
jgi:glycosyltransferase involved in cell wall biosynthesis